MQVYVCMLCVRVSICVCVCVGVWQAFITQLSQLELSNGSLCFKLCRHQLRLSPHACVGVCECVYMCVGAFECICAWQRQLVH